MLLPLTDGDILLIVDTLFANDIEQCDEIIRSLKSTLINSLDRDEIWIESQDLHKFIQDESKRLSSIKKSIENSHSVRNNQFIYFLCCYESIGPTLSKQKQYWFTGSVNALIQLGRQAFHNSIYSLARRMRLCLCETKPSYDWFWLFSELNVNKNDRLDAFEMKLGNFLNKIIVDLANSVSAGTPTNFSTQKKNQISTIQFCFSHAEFGAKKSEDRHSEVVTESEYTQLDLFNQSSEKNSELQFKNKVVSNEQREISTLWRVSSTSRFIQRKFSEKTNDNIEKVSRLNFIPIAENTRLSNSKLSYLAMQHKAKLDMKLFSDVNILTLKNYQQIYQSFSRDFSSAHKVEQRACYAAIMLSMLSGVSINHLIERQNKIESIFKYRNNKYYLVIELGITKLSRKRRQELKNLRLNGSQKFELEMPAQLISAMSKSIISLEDIDTILSQRKSAFSLPYLSIGRIETTASILYSRFIENDLIADVLVNVDGNHSASIYYTSHTKGQLHHYSKSLENLLQSNDIPIDDNKNEVYGETTIGSQITPKFSVVVEIITTLKKSIDVGNCGIESFNRYSVYMWHIFQLLTGVRPHRGLGKTQDIDLTSRLLCISDKKNRHNENARFLPICDALFAELQEYLAYRKRFYLCHQFDSGLKAQRGVKNIELLSLHNKESFFVYVVDNSSLTPATPGLIEQYVKVYAPNWPRHFVKSYFSLKNEASNFMVNGMFNHERVNQEILGRYSSSSMHDIYKFSGDFNDLASDLGFVDE